MIWNEDQSSLLVQVIAADTGAEDRLSSVFDEVNFQIKACSTYTCTGYVPIVGFSELEAHKQVEFIRPPLVDMNQAGDFVSEAVKALRVDLVRMSDPTITGAGIKIGVLSNSFNLFGGYDDDIASGDLPPGIVPLEEGLSYSGPAPDEGRAMMQLIHDLAPGAELEFHTAVGGSDVLKAGIEKLAEAGCDVIVDDVSKCDPPLLPLSACILIPIN